MHTLGRGRPTVVLIKRGSDTRDYSALSPSVSSGTFLSYTYNRYKGLPLLGGREFLWVTQGQAAVRRPPSSHPPPPTPPLSPTRCLHTWTKRVGSEHKHVPAYPPDDYTLFKSNNLDSFTLLLVSFLIGIHFFALSLRDRSLLFLLPPNPLHPCSAPAPLICSFSPKEDSLWEPRPLPVLIRVSPSCTFTHIVASHLVPNILLWSLPPTPACTWDSVLSASGSLCFPYKPCSDGTGGTQLVNW